MVSAEKKFRVPIIPDCLWEIVGQCDDADNAFIVAMLRLIKKRFDGEPVVVPAEYRSAWRLIQGSLTRIEDYRNRKRTIPDHTAPSATIPDHTAPSATIPDHTAPSATIPDHTAPLQPCNVMKGNVMEGNVMDSKESALSRTKETPRKRGASAPDGFDALWEGSGRRGSKTKAKAAFAKAITRPNWPGLPAVLEVIARWRQTPQWTEDGGRYQPHLSTWLNRDGWEESVPEPPVSGQEKLEEQMNNIWLGDNP